MKKRILSLSLASTLLISTVALAGGTNDVEVNNENNEIMLIAENANDKEVINVVDEAEIKSSYINFNGKIKEVNKEDGNISIIVEKIAEEDVFENIRFNITKETVLLSNKTNDFIKADKLVEGAVIEVSYGSDNPMTMSLPPMTNADVVVLKEAKEDEQQFGVKVDKFGKDQISVDNFLKYNITEDTVIVDQEGKKLKEEDLHDENLVVFYGPATTKSIPAQSNAVKIIKLIEEKEIEVPETPETPEVNNEIKVLDKVIYNGKEIKLNHKLYKSGDVFMMPIREVGEALGYKISWQNVNRQVELTKDAHYLTATANQDMYSFAKMTVKLGKASNLTNGTTYVPVNFITEVMQLDMEVTEAGVINIK